MARVREEGDGWKVPPNPLPPDTPVADREWMLPRRRMQPVRCFQQQASLARAEIGTPRSYLYCTRSAAGDVFRQFLDRARAEGWRFVEDIDASHSPHVTAARELAEIFHLIATA